jgi:hypothetical protein
VLGVQGGFLPEMTRREAAMILGLRESAPEERIKDAHKRIMIANHPDTGESPGGALFSILDRMEGGPG